MNSRLDPSHRNITVEHKMKLEKRGEIVNETNSMGGAGGGWGDYLNIPCTQDTVLRYALHKIHRPWVQSANQYSFIGSSTTSAHETAQPTESSLRNAPNTVHDDAGMYGLQATSHEKSEKRESRLAFILQDV